MDLPALVRDVLSHLHSRREVGSSVGLRTMLQQHGYTPNDNVVAFDQAFGGLSFPSDVAGEAWVIANDRGWLVGAELCLTLGGHQAPRGGDPQLGLIPIIYSPNDVIYFMDPSGGCWGQDTIEEDTAVRVATSGRVLLARVVLEVLTWTRDATREVIDGLQGQTKAKERGYILIAEASDAFAQWWWGPGELIAEYQTSGEIEAHTLVTGISLPLRVL